MQSPSSKKSQLPRHGQIKVTKPKVAHAKKHLATIVASAAEVRDYGGHEATGFNSQGAMSPGGAAGADCQTSNAGDTPDADGGGPSGY
jgi:hypothetical protein